MLRSHGLLGGGAVCGFWLFRRLKIEAKTSLAQKVDRPRHRQKKYMCAGCL